MAAAGRRRGSHTKGGVFLLEGDEEFLKEEAARSLIEAHIDPATRDFNLDILRGTDLDPETLASICQTPPMMAEWRVVVVHDAHALAANARMRSAVEDVLARPIPGLALLFLAQLPDRGRAKFWDTVAKAAHVLKFPRPAEGELPEWLIDRAAEAGTELEPAAARALASAIGSELGVLAREIDKLRDYAGDRKTITRKDVEALVGYVPRVNRWDWIDTVGSRRFDKARHELPALLDAGESGVGLVIGLGTHLLRLGIFVSGGDHALTEALPPYQRWLAKRLPRQARGWTRATIDAALADLLRADRLLKSAPLSDRQVMEELLLRLEGAGVRAA